MDRYKFRGERLDNGEWAEGNLILECTGECYIVQSFLCGEYGESIGRDWHLVDPATVGQYTGLQCNVTDEEWYERDILTPDPHSKRTENEVICYDRHQGKYKSVPISLYLANAGNGGWTGFEIKSYQKRIGNVIDNPELLEG